MVCKNGTWARDAKLVEAYHFGDPAAFPSLLGHYQPLLDRTAYRYGRSYGYPDRDDAYQIALISLVKSIHRYDPDKGPFGPFLMRNLSGDAMNEIRDRGSMIRVPRTLLGEYDGTAGSYAIQMQKQSDVAPLPYTYYVGEEEREHGTVEGFADALIDNLYAEQAIAELEPRTADIIQRYFVKDESQRAIAEEHGISQMHVSRLLRKGMAQMKENTSYAQKRDDILTGNPPWWVAEIIYRTDKGDADRVLHWLKQLLSMYEGDLPQDNSSCSSLSNSEKAVLKLLSEGLSNEEIAENLHIAKSTAAGHIDSIYKKMGASGPTARVKAAVAYLCPEERRNGLPAA